MTDNKVEVRIGGRRFGGWKSVRIETGIEQLSRAFALEVTEKFPGSTDFGFFRNGDLVQVYIGDDLVCTGWISSTPIQYDGKSVKVQIQGKSRTVDLVECCPPSAAYVATGSKNAWVGVKGKSGTAITTTSTNPATSWKNQSVSQIIADLAKPYGVTVKDEVGIGKTLTNHTSTYLLAVRHLISQSVIRTTSLLVNTQELILTLVDLQRKTKVQQQILM